MADSTKSTKKKNYVKGSAKTTTFQNGGEVINLDIKIEGKIIGSNGDILPNEAGYARLRLSKLDAADTYGNSHSVYENDYKPEDKKPAAAGKSSSITPAKAKVQVPSTTDDMPF